MAQGVPVQRTTLTRSKRGQIIVTEAETYEQLLSDEFMDSIAEFVVNLLLSKQELVAI